MRWGLYSSVEFPSPGSSSLSPCPTNSRTCMHTHTHAHLPWPSPKAVKQITTGVNPIDLLQMASKCQELDFRLGKREIKYCSISCCSTRELKCCCAFLILLGFSFSEPCCVVQERCICFPLHLVYSIFLGENWDVKYSLYLKGLSGCFEIHEQDIDVELLDKKMREREVK